MKRAQLTVIIIIGLLVLIMASLGIYLTTRQGVNVLVQPEFRGMQQTVRECMETSTKEALTLAAAQGGVIYLSDESQTLADIQVATGVRNTQVVLPSAGQTAGDISTFIQGALVPCVEQAGARDQGYSWAPMLVDAKVDILADNVIVTLNWPITIVRGDLAHELGTQRIRIESEFGALQQSARRAAVITSNDPIDLSALADDIYQHQLQPRSGTSYAVRTQGNQYTFNFIVEDSIDAGPSLSTLPETLTIAVDERKEFPLGLSSDTRVFEDSTIATIEGDNLIIEAGIGGSYTIIVTAQDRKLQQTRRTINVEVN